MLIIKTVMLAKSGHEMFLLSKGAQLLCGYVGESACDSCQSFTLQSPVSQSVSQSVIACGFCSCSFCKWDKIGKEKEFN